MLEVKGLETCYGPSQVLFGMEFTVGDGEVVTLLGRNGMGKTTTIKSVMGMIPTRAGEVSFRGRAIRGWPSYRVARAGLGLVPEGRRIFPNLSVRENLVATEANRTGLDNPWTFDKVIDLFPRLGERLDNWGNQLSGGEQQMLAIGRALLTNPLLLILDEATEGLAPLIRLEIWRCLERVKAMGQAILVIDKNLDHLLRIADRHYVVEKGQVVWSGSSAAFAADETIRERYMGV
jgi:branched-chain amino acid transport system ATP-binding protein